DGAGGAFDAACGGAAEGAAGGGGVRGHERCAGGRGSGGDARRGGARGGAHVRHRGRGDPPAVRPARSAGSHRRGDRHRRHGGGATERGGRAHRVPRGGGADVGRVRHGARRVHAAFGDADLVRGRHHGGEHRQRF